MAAIEVKNQAELDKALEKQSVQDGSDVLVVVGDGRFVFRNFNGYIRTGGSSSPTMEARGSSSPRMEAWDSSSPTMVARGSSSPRMVARGSSSSTVDACGYKPFTGKVGKYAAVTVRDRGGKFNIPGAVILKVPTIDTVEAWVDYKGVKDSRGWITVFKAVDDNFKSGYAFEYPVGKEVKCEDFENAASCGNGLHFCATPIEAQSYFDGATKFLACKVKASEAVLIDQSKIKAPRCKVIGEVDIVGEPIKEHVAS